MKVLRIILPLFALFLAGCSSIPNEAFYGVSYRIQPDTEDDVYESGFVPEIRMFTNTWHVSLRTPNTSERVPSRTVDGEEDVIRVNGAEIGFGRPLWKTDDTGFFNARLDWEISGGFASASESLATTNTRRIVTTAGVREVVRRTSGDRDYYPMGGVGLSLSGHMNTPGSRYSSIGLGVNGGYRTLGKLGDTPYVEFFLALGL